MTTGAQVNAVTKAVIRLDIGDNSSTATVLASLVDSGSFSSLLLPNQDSMDTSTFEGNFTFDKAGYGEMSTTGGTTSPELTDVGENVSIPNITGYLHMFGSNLSSSGLTFLADYTANTLEPDGFSLQNIYVNLFAAQYQTAGLTVTPESAGTTSARDTFLNAAYHNVFGHDATASQLSGWDGSVMDFYKSFTGSEAGAGMAMWGLFQSVSDQGTYAPNGAVGSGTHGGDYVTAQHELYSAAHGTGIFAV